MAANLNYIRDLLTMGVVGATLGLFSIQTSVLFNQEHYSFIIYKESFTNNNYYKGECYFKRFLRFLQNLAK